MMNARRPHFIKGFNPSLSLERLKIPSKFAKHMEGKSSGTVSLMGPSGNTWHADLIQQNDGLFIYDGWEAFVRDHFLENGDSLVFRYDGNLHFTVQIFDLSCCEKETAFSAECHQDLSIFDQHFGKKREREYASLLTNLVDGVPKKMRSSQAHSECITKYQEANNIAEMQLGLQESMNGRCEVGNFLDGSSEFCGSQLKNPVTIALPLSEVPMEDDVGCLSAAEADKMAQSFTSSFPHFTQVMKRFNISGSYTLNIPYQFAMAYLPKCKVKIVLHNSKGESWTVNSIPTTRVQTSHTFCGGWLRFVRGNNINVGDVCIFELVGKCELRVHILRVKQEGLDCENGDVKALANGASGKIPAKLTKKVKGKSRKTQRLTDLEGPKVAFSIEKVKLGIAAKGSALSSKSRTNNGKSGTVGISLVNLFSTFLYNIAFMVSHGAVVKGGQTIPRIEIGFVFTQAGPLSQKNAKFTSVNAFVDTRLGNDLFTLCYLCLSEVFLHVEIDTVIRKTKGSHDKTGSPVMRCMSMKSAPEEKLAAESFISSFPHFVRVMKKFNIGGSYTLKIPYQFSMEHLPDCRTEIILRNLKGECWTVNSIPTLKVQTLHTFCGGWMAFVRDNGIQLGDICIFELVGNCEMRVHISSGVKIGQEYQTGNCPSNELGIGSY